MVRVRFNEPWMFSFEIAFHVTSCIFMQKKANITLWTKYTYTLCSRIFDCKLPDMFILKLVFRSLHSKFAMFIKTWLGKGFEHCCLSPEVTFTGLFKEYNVYTLRHQWNLIWKPFSFFGGFRSRPYIYPYNGVSIAFFFVLILLFTWDFGLYLQSQVQTELEKNLYQEYLM